MKIDELTERVIACAFKVHNMLGAGFLEKVYEKAMMIELEMSGLVAMEQFPVPVYYHDIKIGDYFADIFVADCLIVEIKAVENMTVAHEKQLINYLAATNIENGLLINFGSSVQVKRKFKTFARKERGLDYRIDKIDKNKCGKDSMNLKRARITKYWAIPVIETTSLILFACFIPILFCNPVKSCNHVKSNYEKNLLSL